MSITHSRFQNILIFKLLVSDNDYISCFFNIIIQLHSVFQMSSLKSQNFERQYNIPPQNMPLRREDFSKLKAIHKKQIQETLCPSPSSKHMTKFAKVLCPFSTRKDRNEPETTQHLHQPRQGTRTIYITDLINQPLVSVSSPK